MEWLEQADLVPHAAALALRKAALPGELDAVAAQARALREWFRDFVHKHRGRPLPPNVLVELEPLNQLLARDHEFGQIVGPSQLEFVRERRWSSPNTLLLPLAEAIAEFVCNEDFSQIKACDGAACTLLYLDTTRTHARRWCSMAVCGNRQKQAVHRARASQKRAHAKRRTRDR